jgi:hypothetical protein
MKPFHEKFHGKKGQESPAIPGPDPVFPIPAQVQTLLDKAPLPIRKKFRLWSQAVAALDSAPNLKKRATARIWARRLGVSISTIYGRRCHFRKEGAIALLDKTYSADCWQGHRHGLPDATVHYLTEMARANRLTNKAAIRAFHRQLRAWRQGDVSAKIPGYDAPPAGDPPPGWSSRNLARCLSAWLKPAATAPGPGPILFEIVLQVRQKGNALSFSTAANTPGWQPERQRR